MPSVIKRQGTASGFLFTRPAVAMRGAIGTYPGEVWVLRLYYLILVSFVSSFRWTGLLFASAQSVDFSIPTSWTRPTSSHSYNDRLQIVNDALSPLASLINPSMGTINTPDLVILPQAASLTWVHILHDLYSNSTTYRSLVRNNFQGRLTSDSLIWGLSACYAHRAYSDNSYLQIAQTIWSNTSFYQVTETQAANKSHPARNITIASSCQGSLSPNNVSTAGAVFWIQDQAQDSYINGETIGHVLSLKALVYYLTYLSQTVFGTTNQQMYANAAELAASFVRNFLYNEIVLDGVDVASCTRAATNFGVTYNAGFVLEGLSLLANATANTTWRDFANEVVVSSVNTPLWNNYEGVIVEGVDPDPDNLRYAFKSFLLRGLHTTWLVNSPTSELAQLISAYITVQANALLSDATIAGSNNYTSNWTGPALPEFHPASQVTALHALTPFFNIANNASALVTTPNGASTLTSWVGAKPGQTGAVTPSLASSSHTSVAAVTGGVVGAVLSLLAIMVVFLCLRRRRRASSKVKDGVSTPRSAWVEPFISRNNFAPVFEQPQRLSSGSLTSSAQLRTAPTPIPLSPPPSFQTRSQSSTRPPTFVSRPLSQQSAPSDPAPSFTSRPQPPQYWQSLVGPLSPASSASTGPAPSFSEMSVDSNETLPAYSR
ncbi:hypothetical protein K488DRAFT_88779 [Vararia minispora EC-137]|uniref:Uncharacterized protein n=1 Tax=Vararia minispora EC-137 TaxID=1314806 RepID=A0ACB8QCK5_9AGAM|nr:hypothetical protein K488DRAFT_88779 [Vararia minispora EC-137]